MRTILILIHIFSLVFIIFKILLTSIKLTNITVSENKKFLDIFRIKSIVNALIGFIETKVELYKIQFKEEIAKALSILALVIIFSMVGMLFVLFLSHFISRLLNDLFESQYLGFLIIGFGILSCRYNSRLFIKGPDSRLQLLI